MNSSFSLNNGQEKPAFPFRNIESSHQPCPWSLSNSAPILSSGEIPFLYLTDVPFVFAWTLPVFASLFLWGILVPCWTYQIYFPLSWKLPAHTLPHWPAYTQKGHLFLLYRKHLALWSPVFSRVNIALALQTVLFPDTVKSRQLFSDQSVSQKSP